jgi:hypothetical protein
MNQRPLTPEEQAQADVFEALSLAADGLASEANSGRHQVEPGTDRETYYRKKAELLKGWAQRFSAASLCVGLDPYP